MRNYRTLWFDMQIIPNWELLPTGSRNTPSVLIANLAQCERNPHCNGMANNKNIRDIKNLFKLQGQLQSNFSQTYFDLLDSSSNAAIVTRVSYLTKCGSAMTETTGIDLPDANSVPQVSTGCQVPTVCRTIKQ